MFHTGHQVRDFWESGDLIEGRYREYSTQWRTDISSDLRDRYIQHIQRGLTVATAYYYRQKQPNLDRANALQKARRTMEIGRLLIGAPA
jgi:hypothetical protein